jgi:hypothetical protein
MTIKEMRTEITQVFDAPLKMTSNLSTEQIERAKNICETVLNKIAKWTQIKDMYAFICFCRANPERFKNSIFGGLEGYIQFNITHDIYEFWKNSDEPWFCPRTSGYRKHFPDCSRVKGVINEN